MRDYLIIMTKKNKKRNDSKLLTGNVDENIKMVGSRWFEGSDVPVMSLRDVLSVSVCHVLVCVKRVDV